MYFLFRRLILAILVVFLKDFFFAQFLIKTFTIVFGAMISGAVNLKDHNKRWVDFLNESIIMMVLYTMICFSPFVSDVNAKLKIGYVCMLVVGGHLAINMFLIVFTSVQGLKFKFKIWMARKKLKEDYKPLKFMFYKRKNPRRKVLHDRLDL
jgi:hypothetical protein